MKNQTTKWVASRTRVKESLTPLFCRILKYDTYSRREYVRINYLINQVCLTCHLLLDDLSAHHLCKSMQFAAGWVCMPTMQSSKEKVCEIWCEHWKGHWRRCRLANWSHHRPSCWGWWSWSFACFWPSVEIPYILSFNLFSHLKFNKYFSVWLFLPPKIFIQKSVSLFLCDN